MSDEFCAERTDAFSGSSVWIDLWIAYSELTTQDSELQPIDLGGEYKIAFCKPVDLVRPDRDPHFAPGERNIRMMSLVFGKFSDLIHEAQCRLEIRESQLPFQM